VSSSRRTPGGLQRRARWGRHWKIALCSLSIGTIFALRGAATSCISKAPASTSDSLFASSMRLPARAAARVEFSPAAPTMAAITVSQ
jgi:hypothetical protein